MTAVVVPKGPVITASSVCLGWGLSGPFRVRVELG